MIILFLIIILLLLYFMVLFLKKSSLLSSIKLSSIIWILIIFMNLFLLDNIFVTGFLYIMVIIILMNFGEDIIGIFNSKKVKSNVAIYLSSKVVCFTIIIQIINISLLLLNSPIDFSLSGLLNVSSYYSNLRYLEGIGIPIYVRILNILVYFGIMVASIEFYWKNKSFKMKLLFLTPHALLFFQGFLLGTKSLVVYIVIFLISGGLVAIYLGQVTTKLSKIIKYLSLIFIIAISLVVVIQYFRSSGNLSILKIILMISTSYLIVPIAALIEWINLYGVDEMLNFKLGLNTFKGVSSIFNMIPDVFGEFTYIEYKFGTFRTNVYTPLQSVIKDFGLIPLLFLAPFVGIIIGALRKKLIENNIHFIGIYYSFSIFIIFSFSGNVFSFTTNILSFLFLIIFYIRKGLRIKNASRSSNGKLQLP